MKKLIYLEDAINEIERWIGYLDKDMISRIQIGLERLPSAQPEIVHCRDCKHRGEKPIADGRYWCEIHDTFMYYCSDAERRIDE